MYIIIHYVHCLFATRKRTCTALNSYTHAGNLFVLSWNYIWLVLNYINEHYVYIKDDFKKLPVSCILVGWKICVCVIFSECVYWLRIYVHAYNCLYRLLCTIKTAKYSQIKETVTPQLSEIFNAEILRSSSNLHSPVKHSLLKKHKNT